jgi:hypothetical protein
MFNSIIGCIGKSNAPGLIELPLHRDVAAADAGGAGQSGMGRRGAASTSGSAGRRRC